MNDAGTKSLDAVMPEAARLLNVFAEGCSNTRPFGKKPWACVDCYEGVVGRLQATGVPSRRVAEVMVLAHRYPA